MQVFNFDEFQLTGLDNILDFTYSHLLMKEALIDTSCLCFNRSTFLYIFLADPYHYRFKILKRDNRVMLSLYSPPSITTPEGRYLLDMLDIANFAKDEIYETSVNLGYTKIFKSSTNILANLFFLASNGDTQPNSNMYALSSGAYACIPTFLNDEIVADFCLTFDECSHRDYINNNTDDGYLYNNGYDLTFKSITARYFDSEIFFTFSDLSREKILGHGYFFDYLTTDDYQSYYDSKMDDTFLSVPFPIVSYLTLLLDGYLFDGKTFEEVVSSGYFYSYDLNTYDDSIIDVPRNYSNLVCVYSVELLEPSFDFDSVQSGVNYEPSCSSEFYIYLTFNSTFNVPIKLSISLFYLGFFDRINAYLNGQDYNYVLDYRDKFSEYSC